MTLILLSWLLRKLLIWLYLLMLSIWNPNNQILATRNNHAVHMREFNSCYCSRMKINQFDFFLFFNVPNNYFSFPFRSCYQIFRIRRKTSFEHLSWRTNFVVYLSSKFMFGFAFKRINQKYYIISCAKHNVLAVRTEFYLSDFRLVIRVF